MKKLSKVLLAIIVTVFLFTGCSLRENIEMNISADKNISMSIVMAMDEDMIDSMLTADGTLTKDKITDEKRWEYIDKSVDKMDDSYKKEKYNQDGYKGYKYTIELGTLDDISTTSSDKRVDLSEAFEGKFKGNNLFIKEDNTYISNMKYTVEGDNDYSQYESMGAMFDLNFVINIPNQAKDYNADKLENEGTRLTWSLMKSADIEFKFDLDSKANNNDTKEANKENDSKNNNTIIIIGAVIGGILLIAIIVLIIVLSKKNKNNN